MQSAIHVGKRERNKILLVNTSFDLAWRSVSFVNFLFVPLTLNIFFNLSKILHFDSTFTIVGLIKKKKNHTNYLEIPTYPLKKLFFNKEWGTYHFSAAKSSIYVQIGRVNYLKK